MVHTLYFSIMNTCPLNINLQYFSVAERYLLFIWDIKSTSVVPEPTSIFYSNVILKVGAVLLIMPWA